MSADQGAARVLVVLDDTSSGTASDLAVGLHRALVSRGIEVRSIALGPGGDGALDATVPVLAPAPGSLAAVLQLRREQRWADLVVCGGRRAARAHRMGGPGRRASVQLADLSTLTPERMADAVRSEAVAAR